MGKGDIVQITESKHRLYPAIGYVEKELDNGVLVVIFMPWHGATCHECTEVNWEDFRYCESGKARIWIGLEKEGEK